MAIFSHDCIGTHLEIRIETDQECGVLFSRIQEYLSQFEERFSRFRENNWLSDLNRDRHADLDEDARFMLSFALDVARKTDGYFDPTIGKRLTELGYGKKNTHQEVYTKEFSDYRDIEIRENEVILHGDVELEFGGVGKGYLIDIIEEMVRDFFSRETPFFLINFGGDMYGYGEWRIALESPFSLDEAIGMITLADDYLACSAPTRRAWSGGHHLIDPKTGNPAKEVIATFIEGTSGILTDSYATALSVMPWDAACLMLTQIPHISGVLVRYDGSLFQSPSSRSELFT